MFIDVFPFLVDHFLVYQSVIFSRCGAISGCISLPFCAVVYCLTYKCMSLYFEQFGVIDLRNLNILHVTSCYVFSQWADHLIMKTENEIVS